MGVPTRLSPVLLLCATLLLLLVSLSAPIVRSIYLLNLHAVNDPNATQIHFGVWGYCLVLPAYKHMSQCSATQVGYVVPDEFLAATGLPKATTDIIVKGLTYVLVLHPLCALITAAALLPGVLTLCNFGAHAWGIVSLILTCLAAVLTTVSAAVDITLVSVAQNRLDALQAAFAIAIDFSNAVWMTVAAAVLLWIEVITASMVVCDCCGFGIEHEHDDAQFHDKSPPRDDDEPHRHMNGNGHDRAQTA
ncbi:SUR7/PalI family-domain-containing protein [Auriculariales sp. MPI-PUGE-AT-0066]|nr:SUR7/PalI family-domain-containing protein [Auriculariales sp. MPI-PUGE-AT-0066]